MNVSQAVEGYLLDRQAGGYSSGTIHLYRLYLKDLCEFLGDPPLDQVTLQDLQRFMLLSANELQAP